MCALHPGHTAFFLHFSPLSTHSFLDVLVCVCGRVCRRVCVCVFHICVAEIKLLICVICVFQYWYSLVYGLSCVFLSLSIYFYVLIIAV